MKKLIFISAALLLTGCGETKMSEPLGISMILQNHEQAFVSERLAKRWAELIVDEKYPKDIFLPQAEVGVRDDGDFWVISFQNALKPTEERPLVSRSMKIRIRKSDGAVEGFSP